MSVCLSVCLFVCPLAYFKKPRDQISPNFLHTLHVAVARSSSDGNAMLCISVFWMTSCLHATTSELAGVKDDAWSSLGGGTGGKVCRL